MIHWFGLLLESVANWMGLLNERVTTLNRAITFTRILLSALDGSALVLTTDERPTD